MKKSNNYFSSKITNDDNLPAAQAMLYATGLTEKDLKKIQVAIVSNWYEGNPCNMHLNQLGKEVKNSIHNENIIGFQFNTIGVSDGITMGTSGMNYSLPSRELIADSIETMVKAHYHDGVIAIPGCDKNIPGSLIALLRINRPSIVVYGGTIKSGYYKGEKLNIVSSLEGLGKKNEGTISEIDFKNIIKKSCPGAGSCGGMYTANTMAVALETMGITLPYSSSTPATNKEKIIECSKIGKYIKYLISENIKPKDIINYKSIKNAITICMALGGSTNLVLHMLAIAKTAEINLNIDNFQKISESVPLIGNLKPSGDFLMEDIYDIGGTPIIIKYLINEGFIEGDCMTITGKTLSENLKNIKNLNFNQKIIFPIKSPIKKNGNINILYGNLANEGSVAKISGKEGLKFTGPAHVFNSEESANYAILNKKINKGEVIVIRYVGPKGGPGMPEMLKPTAYIMGSGIGNNVALITDGRFSGGSHGFVVGHISPEAYMGGNIALIKNGDMITIDIEKKSITLEITNEELKTRKNNWKKIIPKITSGYLYKYSKLVTSASEGCITDKF